ncbi:MAG: LytTR family DNA-binding domain-containing protein [Clostridium sp.]|nr:LytTR family DNA-binding domain-containing protein [Clostridium sp.]MCM1547103.1 LytTR family DNA-binding domain-containing protein [Ruminococcus sp.]
MKIAICEDEDIYSGKISKAVAEYFGQRDIRIDISLFTDGEPLVSAYKEGSSFDLIFFDIQLENTDGMSSAAEIRKIDDSAVIIFVTSIENRAVEGYAVNAFDYIVKSSLDDRLYSVLDRFMQASENSFIIVQTLNGDTDMIACSDILYVQSEGRYTAIVKADGVIKSALSVSKTAELLPKDKFVETHKSVYVQTLKIKRIGSDTAEMINGDVLPLSRRKRKAVLSAVMNAVKGSAK